MYGIAGKTNVTEKKISATEKKIKETAGKIAGIADINGDDDWQGLIQGCYPGTANCFGVFYLAGDEGIKATAIRAGIREGHAGYPGLAKRHGDIVFS